MRDLILSDDVIVGILKKDTVLREVPELKSAASGLVTVKQTCCGQTSSYDANKLNRARTIFAGLSNAKINKIKQLTKMNNYTFVMFIQGKEYRK